MADATVALELDAQYRAMREGAAVVHRPPIDAIDVTGSEAGDYLQGQLTNAVEALAAGEGLYAALLDRKANIQADMRVEAGAEQATEQAAEIVRVESGRPRYGHEMGPETMPAEAGIVERAVDFEKGCYIGQEPVARLHYRGRPNRTLRGLSLDGPAQAGSSLRLGDKMVGQIGTACVSPALGPIALAVVRREAE